MARKDVVEYFNQVADQYQEMMDNIKELEVDVNNNLTSPDLLERLKEMTKPIKDNYMTLSYIMFLLNKPTRKEKAKRYEQMNKKLLSAIDKSKTKDGIIAENNETLKNMETFKK